MSDTDVLNDGAAGLLRQMQLTPPREPGEKLRAADEARILELHTAGHSQVDIARAVGCHQSTVSRTLAEYDDSRPLARKYLEAQALAMTKRLVSDARPETILRVLAKLDVVRDDRESGAVSDGPTLFLGNEGRALVQFSEHDTIVYTNACLRPNFVDGEVRETPKQLQVQRWPPDCAAMLFDLPCPISEIPPHVKVTPEAAKYIRAQLQPAIEAAVVEDAEAR
jgi:hypothetical protein